MSEKVAKDPESGLSDASIAPSTRALHGPRGGIPDWAPWAVLGGLLVAGTGGSLALSHGAHAAGLPSTAASAPAARASAPAASAGSSRTPLPEVGSSAAPAADDARISVMHLVVTHDESIMGQKLGIKRSRAAALERTREALARARKGDDFGQLVVEYSEEPHAQETKGQLANFQRKDAIPSFADAAFKLKPGELSDVVDTPFGYMVIERTK
jgi:peptidyl-prolyl cis-trans isomerase NIMA-interacting 1